MQFFLNFLWSVDVIFTLVLSRTSLRYSEKPFLFVSSELVKFNAVKFSVIVNINFNMMLAVLIWSSGKWMLFIRTYLTYFPSEAGRWAKGCWTETWLLTILNIFRIKCYFAEMKVIFIFWRWLKSLLRIGGKETFYRFSFFNCIVSPNLNTLCMSLNVVW